MNKKTLNNNSLVKYSDVKFIWIPKWEEEKAISLVKKEVFNLYTIFSVEQKESEFDPNIQYILSDYWYTEIVYNPWNWEEIIRYAQPYTSFESFAKLKEDKQPIVILDKNRELIASLNPFKVDIFKKRKKEVIKTLFLK